MINQEDRERLVDMRQAALWLGCTPVMLLNMREYGWLKTVEEIDAGGKKLRWTKCSGKYRLKDLDRVVWDIANSLSFYDIAAIRQSKLPAKRIYRITGIPARVCELVREAYVFGWIELLLYRYAEYRRRDKPVNFDVELPFPPCPFTLPKMMPRLTARESVPYRRGLANRQETRSEKALLAPVPFGRRPAHRIFGPQGRLDMYLQPDIESLWPPSALDPAAQEFAPGYKSARRERPTERKYRRPEMRSDK